MGKTIGVTLGIVFLLIGILGFIDNPLIGPEAIFQTNLAHNLVHLLTGALFLIFATREPATNALFMKVFGVIYLLVAVLGFATASEGGLILGLIDSNSADHWLHVVIGLAIFLIGLSLTRSSSHGMSPAHQM